MKLLAWAFILAGFAVLLGVVEVSASVAAAWALIAIGAALDSRKRL